MIARQHGQPLTPAQMQDLRKTRPGATPRNDRVKLVPAVAEARQGATRARSAEPAARNQPARSVVQPRPAEPSARRVGPTEPFKNNAHPIPSRNQPVQPTRRTGELPSARFAHPGERTLPRAPVIRPSGEPQRSASTPGRLPVVRPVERAPQSTPQHATPQPRQTDIQSQQRQAQAQQRQAQMQAQQRQREQAVQQQRSMQMQQQQRSMQMQQQQRAMEMQRQQQMRERQVQRAPQRYTPPARNRPAPEHREPPPKKHPPPSSDH